jgi:hypothetical protein
VSDEEQTGKSKSRQDSVYGVVNVGEDRTLSVHYDWQTNEIEIENGGEGVHENRTQLRARQR